MASLARRFGYLGRQYDDGKLCFLDLCNAIRTILNETACDFDCFVPMAFVGAAPGTWLPENEKIGGGPTGKHAAMPTVQVTAKSVEKETIVEVPRIEYVEVPKIQYVEKVVEVEKTVIVEKIVEKPMEGTISENDLCTILQTCAAKTAEKTAERFRPIIDDLQGKVAALEKQLRRKERPNESCFVASGST